MQLDSLRYSKKSKEKAKENKNKEEKLTIDSIK